MAASDFLTCVFILLSLSILSYSKSTVHHHHYNCADMIKKECRDFARTEYGYTTDDIDKMPTIMRLIIEHRIACKLNNNCLESVESQKNERVNCRRGKARKYSCSNVDLLSIVSLTDLGSSNKAFGNDLWGWTNPSDNSRYVITGQEDGTTIVDITNPLNPDILCFIASEVPINLIWRDIKTVTAKNGVEFAVIIADSSTMYSHGIQYIPLIETINICRNSNDRPYHVTQSQIGRTLVGIFSDSNSGNVHNIIKSQSDNFPNRVYLVGSRSYDGGLMIVDFSNVKTVNDDPVLIGTYSDDGYIHDAQCFTYKGPHTKYSNKDICITFGVDRVLIIDVTKARKPKVISRVIYSESGYIHQGWITSDHRYVLMNDELDELVGIVPSQTTYIINIDDLSKPITNKYETGISSIDHNLYTKEYTSGEFVFESNYEAGLRIFGLDNIASSVLNPVGYFDTFPKSTSIQFGGLWSSYIYFDDVTYPGLVAANDRNTGLFIFDTCKAVGVDCGPGAV